MFYSIGSQTWEVSKSLEGLLKLRLADPTARVPDSVVLGCQLRICISIMFMSDGGAADLRSKKKGNHRTYTKKLSERNLRESLLLSMWSEARWGKVDAMSYDRVRSTDFVLYRPSLNPFSAKCDCGDLGKLLKPLLSLSFLKGKMRIIIVTAS